MNTPPPRNSFPDLFDDTSAIPHHRPARFNRPSLTYSDSPLFDPHQLISNLTASRHELLEAEANATMNGGNSNGSGNENGQGMGITMEGRSRQSIGSTGGINNNDPSSSRRRNHAILLHLANDQANTGISSVAPQSIGPPLNRYGGTGILQDGDGDDGMMSISVGARSLKRSRESTSSRGSYNDTPGSSTGMGMGGFVGAAGIRARESLPGNARQRAPTNLRQADLLRRAASTRNLPPRSSLGASSYTGSPILSSTNNNNLLPNTSTPIHGSNNDPSSLSTADIPDIDIDIEVDADLGNEAGNDLEDMEEPNPSWEMIGRMRTWRNDAIMQHLYETAGFWGDKILTWTAEPNDAFWLAQAHFLTQNYVKAERILKSILPKPRMPFTKSVNYDNDDENFGSHPSRGRAQVFADGRGDGKDKGKNRDMSGAGPDMDMTGMEFGRPDEGLGQQADKDWLEGLWKENKGGLWGALQENDDDDDGDGSGGGNVGAWKGEKGRLCDWSMNCRYLLSLCLLHQEKFLEALKLVGEEDPFARISDQDGAKIPSKAGDLKLRSSLCRVRGALHYRLNSLERAKECYMEALALDVRNYDVFLELVNEMMTPDEEWDFIQSLSYKEQLAEDDAEFVKTVYTSRLNKHHLHAAEIREARFRLEKDYNLGGNCDTLAAAAEDLYLKNRLEDCYIVTTKILSKIPNHPTGLRLHLACQVQMPRLASSLFMLAHKLVEQEPMTPTTWYAVGLWYYAGRRWAEARRYFAATHDEDSRFGPAWIAFAHTLAYEGEHEQAITAYSTTARIFPGNYFPHVCIGMEYLQLANYDMAEDHFLCAYSMCKTDPLLLNELGVIYYNKEDFDSAIKYFEAAIAAVKRTQGILSQWASTYSNLGHACRRLGKLNAAASAYDQALRLNVLDVHVYSSLGMMAQEVGNVRKAIDWYHKALSISPQDAIATVLLESALPDMVDLGPASFPGLPAQLAQTDYVPWPADQPFEPSFPKLLPLEQGYESPRSDNIQAPIRNADLTEEGSTMDIE